MSQTNKPTTKFIEKIKNISGDKVQVIFIGGFVGLVLLMILINILPLSENKKDSRETNASNEISRPTSVLSITQPTSPLKESCSRDFVLEYLQNEIYEDSSTNGTLYLDANECTYDIGKAISDILINHKLSSYNGNYLSNTKFVLFATSENEEDEYSSILIEFDLDTGTFKELVKVPALTERNIVSADMISESDYILSYLVRLLPTGCTDPDECEALGNQIKKVCDTGMIGYHTYISVNHTSVKVSGYSENFDICKNY